MNIKKYIQSSKSWKDLNNTLESFTKSNRAKLAGDIFECLTKLYLETAPQYKSKLRKVYLEKEVPSNLRKKLNLPDTDEGIDLIAETNDKEYWAIQCKYRSNSNETLTIKEDLSTFNNLAFTHCKNITHGIVCATVNKPPKKIKLLKSIGFELLETWLGLDDGDLFTQIKAKASGKILKPKPLTPRLHQKIARLKTISHFKNSDRGKIIMPCGTGKSLTAFWIAKKMGVKSILIAVPSLALLQQTLKVWTREFLINGIEPEWFCVCSDGTVKDDQDDYVTDTSDLGIKVDTDPKLIKQFLRKKTSKIKVLFTTYQSGRATAIGSRGFTYDLGIMDEAHKTVGSKTKEMAHLLHQKNVKIKKRIFMTATERLFRGDSDEFMSMDDPRDYGDLIYELSFKEAINAKPPIISDYKIITFGITVPEIEEIYNSNKYLEVKKVLKDITARELATALALRKAIKQYKINNAISFHRSIRRADNFRTQQDLITKIYPEYGKLKSFHVAGDMPTATRATQMREFAKGKGLMTNARCLTEGVDLPAIDCVCFTDPKRSKVDIVQAAGRALRLSKGKKFGYILIPIFIPAGTDFNEAAKEQGFDDVAITVRSLAATDIRISEYLKVIAEGKKPKGGSPVDGLTSVNSLYKVEAEEFDRAIKLKIWDKVAIVNWRSFKDARYAVSKFNLKNANHFREYRRKNKEIWDIPSSPHFIYKNEWKGWGHFLNTRSRSQAVTFEEASNYAVKNKIKSGTQWKKFIKKNRLPYNIPKSPEAFYIARGSWTNWGDFLKTGSKSRKEYDYKYTFSQIQKICKKNKIQNFTEYKKFVKKNPKLGLPQRINRHYKEYKSAKNFFGSNIPKFKDLRRFVKINNIKSMLQWRRFYERNKDKYNLVREPGNIKELKKDWKGSRDFLGLKKKRFYLNECIKILKPIGLKNSVEYIDFISKNKTINLPRFPKETFTKNEYWPGWSKYLSAAKFELVTYEKAKKILKPLKLKSVKDFKNKINSIDKRIPRGPEPFYKAQKKWEGWNIFLGKPEILKYENAKKFIKKFNFKVIEDYQNYIRKNQIKFLPLHPRSHYKKEFISTFDFLSSNQFLQSKSSMLKRNQTRSNRIYWMSFEESRKFARSLRLKSASQWKNLKKNKKIRLPQKLSLKIVNSQEFTSWKDFLGSTYVGNDSEMLKINEAKKIVKKLNVKSTRDYAKLDIKIKKKYKIPSNPFNSYKKEWKGWTDFLGKKK